MKPTTEQFGTIGANFYSDNQIFSCTPVELAPKASLEANEADTQHSPGPLTLHEVAAYYSGRTAHILRRYGPGPRVHYHTGLVDELGDLDVPAAQLRRRLVTAQERILEHGATTWQAASHLSGEVIDVGCGLGGGAIFWAQEYGANVTAVTCVPMHAAIVDEFAVQAGVGSKVKPVISDILHVTGQDFFDAAVAFDASCHLPRKEWFRRLFALLRSGGRVFISDCFLGRPEYARSFDQYFHARIGMIAEYLATAREAGLEPIAVEDLSNRVADFFSITRALIKQEALAPTTDPVERTRLAASLHEHTILRQGLRDHGYVYAQMSFRKA